MRKPPAPAHFYGPYRPESWNHLLTLKGDRVAIWASPTNRYFLGDPFSPPSTGVGCTKLAECIASGARREAVLRNPSLRVMDALIPIRTVLWETQATPAYWHADRSTQLALELALVTLVPSVAASNSRSTRGGGAA